MLSIKIGTTCRISDYVIFIKLNNKAGKYSGPRHQWSQKFFWTPRKERGRKEKTTRRKERRGRKRKNEGRREKEGKEGENMKEDVKTKPKIKSSKRKKRNED